MATTPGSPITRFGPFQLDMQTGELSRAGLRIGLPQQSFLIFALLLERPGEVIRREEIQQKLWPGDTYVDFEHGVNNSIKRLREALGDSAEKPRYIETLPRRGYRFIGDISKLNGTSSYRSASSDSSSSNGSSRVELSGPSVLGRQVFVLTPADNSDGKFEFDIPTFRLFQAGTPLSLEPKALHLLRFMLDNRNRLIRKHELLDAVWPESNVGETALTRAIALLRKVFEDDSKVPQFIETVPTLGYRFIAHVATPDQPVANDQAVAPEADIGGQMHPRRRWWAGAVALAIAAAGVGYSNSHRKPPLTGQDTIVLDDFANSTSDTVFDGTLRQGLATQLEQSPFLSLVSDRRIQETLNMMEQPADARLSPPIAREVCERTASAAILDGSITSFGNHYVLGLKATSCRSGALLVEEQAEATNKENVLRTLDQIATKMRSRLGESLASVEKYDTRLEEATTSSLEALRAFSMARQRAAVGNYKEAEPFLQRAVELDPNFALAYHDMSWGHLIHQPERSREYLAKAYALRQRVSEHERLMIERDYYQFVEVDAEKAVATQELLARSYPRDWEAALSLSVAYRSLGEWELALAPALAANRLAPDIAGTYENLGTIYISVGRFEDAAATYKSADDRKLSDSTMTRSRYQLAFLQGDAQAMAHWAASAMGRPEAEGLVLLHQSFTEAWYGRMQSARDLVGRASTGAQRNGSKERAAIYLTDLAVFDAAIGADRMARKETEAGMKLALTGEARDEGALALAIVGDDAKAERLVNDIQTLEARDSRARRYWLPAIQAELALQRKHPEQALALLGQAEIVDALHIHMVPTYFRGNAYLMLHDGNRAAMEFQKFVDRGGVVRNSPFGQLARLGLARAYEMQGDTARARGIYETFLKDWKDADSDIPILKQARSEYAALQ
jgi:DNA-binding winged helix-turn-helix (wHTH) protein/tetratricopeptide (TPR) repeat protein